MAIYSSIAFPAFPIGINKRRKEYRSHTSKTDEKVKLQNVKDSTQRLCYQTNSIFTTQNLKISAYQ